VPACEPTDQYVRIGQINTRFWTAGDGGKAVVLIHGLGRYVEDWQYNIHALAERHRVYAVDLVGSGCSDKPPATYSLSYLVRFVGDFLEAQKIDRASLMGHSLGGSVALQYAIQYPAQVEKLVLVNSAGLGKELPLGLRLSSLPLAGEWLTRPSRKGIAESLRRSVYDPTLLTDEWVQLCYQQATLPGAQRALLDVIRSFIGIGGMRDEVIHLILDNLAQVTAPTLIVWGQQDRIVPVAHAQIAKGRMPHARLQIFDPCGHFPQRERPAEFNALVLDFLSGPSVTSLPKRLR
jgi:4,5:9,10-diseco-3-hydroxy-5,9,17-trioxoandrosta-1(10),2-diene-4-oate hydrolase